MSSGVDRNIVATSKQYLNATQSIYLKQQFDIDAESKDFRRLLKAKRSGEYSTPDHVLSGGRATDRNDRMDYPYTKPDRPTPEEIQRRKIEMAMMNKPSPDMMKSIQKSYKDLMEKGSPVPDWARPKNANRRDIMYPKTGANITNDFKDIGGDAYDYGGGYNQMQVTKEPEYGVGGIGKVKDFATGTYGDTDKFAGGNTSGYYTGNALDTRVITGSGKDEDGDDVYNRVGERPKGGRTSVSNASPLPSLNNPMPVQENPNVLDYNKEQELNQRINPFVTDIAGRDPTEYVSSNPYLQNQQQQQGQVQTGEPMDLAFRLLKGN